jgi:hypothetical protein
VSAVSSLAAAAVLVIQHAAQVVLAAAAQDQHSTELTQLLVQQIQDLAAVVAVVHLLARAVLLLVDQV